jgi:hypothetical protein
LEAHANSPAIQFAADDVLVMLCEREAAAQVYSAMFAEATAAVQVLAATVGSRSVKNLVGVIHSRTADAELESMYLRHTLLDLARRDEGLWISKCLFGHRDDG